MKRLFTAFLIALGLATLGSTPALAQAWPNKTIRMVRSESTRLNSSH